MSLKSSILSRLSDTFVISCGTITLDPTQARVLLIRWKKNGEVFLPKGRKNIGEALVDAAVRETYEETGVRVTLLPLRIPTLAMLEAAATVDCGLSTKPFAFSQRTMDDGTLKLIFRFCAQGDSMAPHDTGTQEEGEDFEPVWAGFENAVETLTFRDDKDIAEKVVQLYKSPS